MNSTEALREIAEKWGASMGHGFTNEELSADLNSLSLPPADGAEEILHKYVHTINSDGTSLVTFMGALKAMREFAAQQQPTAEGAEDDDEIILGEPDKLNLQWSGYGVFGNCKQRQQPTSEGAKEILDKYPHSIEYPSFVHENSAIAAMQEFAALHAQKIADKMVEERLREDEK